MADTKRFYWLKLKEDFFRQKEIKKLRKIAGGDTFTIIYLKMLLRSLKDGGRLYYEGIEDNFASELALDIDEDEDNVKVTVAFLLANGILTQNQTDEYEILTAQEMTASECDSAHRVRRLRAQKAMTEEQQALLCNATVTDSNGAVTDGNVEIDIDIDKENREKSKRKKGATAQRFTPPTLEQVQEYAKNRGYSAHEFSPQDFIDFYTSKGWRVGRDSMKDWQASVRTWVSRYRKEHPNEQPTPEEPVLTLQEQLRRGGYFADDE